MSFLINCALIYIGIVYGLIPLLCIAFSIIMLIGGAISKLYYLCEDYLTTEHKENK